MELLFCPISIFSPNKWTHADNLYYVCYRSAVCCSTYYAVAFSARRNNVMVLRPGGACWALGEVLKLQDPTLRPLANGAVCEHFSMPWKNRCYLQHFCRQPVKFSGRLWLDRTECYTDSYLHLGPFAFRAQRSGIQRITKHLHSRPSWLNTQGPKRQYHVIQG